MRWGMGVSELMRLTESVGSISGAAGPAGAASRRETSHQVETPTRARQNSTREPSSSRLRRLRGGGLLPGSGAGAPCGTCGSGCAAPSTLALEVGSVSGWGDEFITGYHEHSGCHRVSVELYTLT